MKINKITLQFHQVFVSYGETNLQIDYDDYILKVLQIILLTTTQLI